ncbi:MAG: hypothetical protein H7834_10295 [Magnetococcus sp. YQC-9]
MIKTFPGMIKHPCGKSTSQPKPMETTSAHMESRLRWFFVLAMLSLRFGKKRKTFSKKPRLREKKLFEKRAKIKSKIKTLGDESPRPSLFFHQLTTHSKLGAVWQPRSGMATCEPSSIGVYSPPC